MFDLINRIKTYAEAQEREALTQLEVKGDRLASKISAARFTTLIFLGIAIIAVYTIPHLSPKTPRIQSTTIQK